MPTGGRWKVRFIFPEQCPSSSHFFSLSKKTSSTMGPLWEAMVTNAGCIDGHTFWNLNLLPIILTVSNCLIWDTVFSSIKGEWNLKTVFRSVEHNHKCNAFLHRSVHRSSKLGHPCLHCKRDFLLLLNIGQDPKVNKPRTENLFQQVTKAWAIILLHGAEGPPFSRVHSYQGVAYARASSELPIISARSF